jgi:hypothetical protein
VKRLLLLAAALAAGCGYVGEPLPPLLNIPSRVADLKVRQIGDRLHIEFTIPPLTTEGEVLKSLGRIDLRVGASSEGQFNADSWAAAAQRVEDIQPVDRAVRTAVPAAPWAGRNAILGVDLIGENGRRAGWSNLVTVAVVPPLPQPADVRAENVREGVRVSWRADGSAVRILRQAPEEKEFTLAGETAASPWVDKTVAYGKTYRYRARLIAKTPTGEAWSELSAEAQITPEDRFAPAAPAGLTAVPSTASVELVWEPAPEPARYRVYRSSGGESMKQVAEVDGAPAYSDRGIESGKTYRYAVSAIDAAGNESEKSAAIEVTTL